MINRLVAESTVKVPFKGQPYFSVSKKLLCFQTDNHTKIKALSREAKDIQILFNNRPIQFSLSQHHSWFYQLTHNRLLQIYQIQYTNGLQDGSCKKIGIIHNVEKYEEIKNGLILQTKNSVIKIITFKQLAEATQINLNIEASTLKSITQAANPFVWKAYPSSQRVIVTRCKEEQLESTVQPTTDIFDKIPNSLQYEKSNSFTFLNQILAIYKDRFVFQRKQEKEVEIYDLEQSKLIGKFHLEGTLKFSQIRENLLLIITNKEQTDYFNFFVLSSQSNAHLPLITNRTTYEKGKGDYYKFINLQSSEATIILDKKKNVDISDTFITKISEGTASLVYALNKAKQKVQIIKIDHSKILKSPFGEDKLDKIVYSKKTTPSQSIINQTVELQRSRIHSAVESKNAEKNMQQLQKKFVQNLIDIKLKGVMRKFQQLEKKVENLERLIKGINEKVQNNLSKINRQEIKQHTDKVFDMLTPQFQKYFDQIFKQVSGVLDQGVNYYNMKLAKQAELHKQALTQIVKQTFKATEEIIQISQKEQNISEKTEQHLRRILDSKRKWTKATEQHQSKIKEVPSPNLKIGQVGQNKVQGKVFVRADLNYPNSRREG